MPKLNEPVILGPTETKISTKIHFEILMKYGGDKIKP